MGFICERCAEVEDAKEATVGLTLIVCELQACRCAQRVAIAAYAAAAAHSPAAKVICAPASEMLFKRADYVHHRPLYFLVCIYIANELRRVSTHNSYNVST